MDYMVINCIDMQDADDIDSLLASSAVPGRNYSACFILATKVSFVEHLKSAHGRHIRERLNTRLNVSAVAILFYNRETHCYEQLDVCLDGVSLASVDFDISVIAQYDLELLLKKQFQ